MIYPEIPPIVPNVPAQRHVTYNFAVGMVSLVCYDETFAAVMGETASAVIVEFKMTYDGFVGLVSTLCTMVGLTARLIRQDEEGVMYELSDENVVSVLERKQAVKE